MIFARRHGKGLLGSTLSEVDFEKIADKPVVLSKFVILNYRVYANRADDTIRWLPTAPIPRISTPIGNDNAADTKNSLFYDVFYKQCLAGFISFSSSCGGPVRQRGLGTALD